MAGGQHGDDGAVVFVPAAPGRLVRPGGRSTDGLDDLIDELLPDTDEGPGTTDLALLGGGAAVIAWTVFGSPPSAATIAGVAALGLGSILPLRSAWRWLSGRRRSRDARLRIDDVGVARLVGAYEALDEVPATTGEARAAAHGALLEVASLLDGRTPASDAERRYVAARVTAVEALVAALRELEAVGRRSTVVRHPSSSPRPGRSSTRWGCGTCRRDFGGCLPCRRAQRRAGPAPAPAGSGESRRRRRPPVGGGRQGRRPDRDRPARGGGADQRGCGQAGRRRRARPRPYARRPPPSGGARRSASGRRRLGVGGRRGPPRHRATPPPREARERRRTTQPPRAQAGAPVPAPPASSYALPSGCGSASPAGPAPPRAVASGPADRSGSSR